jgi:hypothetical protein
MVNDGGYEVEDLDRLIENSRRNIEALQKGIDAEQANIDHWKKVRQDQVNRQQLEVIIDAQNEAAMEQTREELAEDGVQG